jgi:UDP-N-acetylmuramoylalanine--D-glutamate ligase
MRTTKVLLLGLGRFGGGTATVRYLAGLGYRIRVADQAEPETLRESVASLADLPRLEFCLGRNDDFLIDGVDLVVCNPAIPSKHRLLTRAAAEGIPVTQEVNIFLSSYPGRVVAVTGTNGKSSTATLLAAALRRMGIATLLGGNIGHSLLDDAGNWGERQVAVLELSSFQLERVDPTQHRVAGTVFTRVTEDHLDRHGTVKAYHAAKAKAAAMAGEFLVHEAGDEVVAAMEHTADRTLTYGTSAADVSITATATGRELWSRLEGDPGLVLTEAALAMPGSYQLRNAAAAYAAASQFGIGNRHATGFAMAITPPLPHRLQLAASVDGIRIFDNSVSTQVESTLSALSSLRGRVHWVGGGKSKDGRFQEPGRELSSQVATAHLFGSAAPELSRAMADRVTTTVHDGLEDALDAAWAQSRAGETILFSPAFASFDQFPNFAARAARFEAWVDRVRHAEHASGTASAVSPADGSRPPG